MRRASTRPRFWVALVVAAVTTLTACSGAVDRSPQRYWAQEWASLPNDYHDLPPTKVAIVDSGLQPHAGLDGHVVGAWEAASLADQERNEHATEVASLVIGLDARDPEKALPPLELLDVRVVGADGSGSIADLAEGISWAAKHSPDLVVVSLSVAVDDDGLRSAVEEAQAAGALVLASTANGFLESPTFPAEYEGVVGVTGVRDDLTLAPRAGLRGADIAAPGHRVLAVGPDGPARVSGTSFANALAAGIVARCPGPRITTEHELVRLAKTSGVNVTLDTHSAPVLRCTTEERKSK